MRSHLTRSRFVAREQTVDQPQDTERVTSSRTTEGDFRASQNVSDFTLSIHATYCTSIELFTKKKGMFKRERTCDLMILNSVTLLGGIGTRSSLARVSFSLCPACQATRRLRGDGSARPRHSPSRRGVTPACPEGPGSTRRSAGHKTTGIRKGRSRQGDEVSQTPRCLGPRDSGVRTPRLTGTWPPVLGYLLDRGRRTSGPGHGTRALVPSCLCLLRSTTRPQGAPRPFSLNAH